MRDLERAAALLKSGGYTLAAVSGETTLTSTERGVKPLLALYDDHTELREFSVADKVIGKAAAFLYVLLMPREIHTCVISEPALAVLERARITVRYETLTPAIRNRAGTGSCPMETAVRDTEDPWEAVELIRGKLAEMGRRQGNAL